MGTGNFMKRDAKKYYVVTDEQRDYVVDAVYEELEKLEKKTSEYSIHFGVGEDDYRVRGHFAESIGEISVRLPFSLAGVEEEVADIFWADINVYIRNGYYEHANLDYEVTIKDEIFGEIEDEDELFGLIEAIKEEYGDEITQSSKEKLSVVVIKRYVRLIELKNELIQKIEEILEKYSEPYNLYVQFDNGETIYAADKPKKKQKTAKMGI